MFNFYRTPVFLAAPLAIATLLTGCGGQAFSDRTSDGTSPNSVVSNTTTSGTSTTNTSTTTTDNSLPAETYSFTVTGAGGTAPSFTVDQINTDTILKVKVVAGSAGALSLSTASTQYSNFSATYRCVQYSVTAVGRTVQTAVLAVNGGDPTFCPNAPSEQTVDFSQRLTSGHGAITVSVQAISYDFYGQLAHTCYNSYGAWGFYNSYTGCYGLDQYMYNGMHTVFKNHSVTGNLVVQTNGTSM